jgi:phosphate transport system protein
MANAIAGRYPSHRRPWSAATAGCRAPPFRHAQDECQHEEAADQHQRVIPVKSLDSAVLVGQCEGMCITSCHVSAAEDLARATAAAMERATIALEEADAALADDIVADSVRLDRDREELARRVHTVLALRAPAVTVLAAIHALTELERLGRLVLEVARTVQRRYPHPVPPHAVTPDFVELGRIAVWLAELAADDGHVRASIRVEDDLADLRRILTALSEPGDVAVLSRLYERFADHAVVLGRLMKSAVPGSQVTGTAA